MKQIKQPNQIIKILQNKNSEDNQELIFVQEYSLVQLKENNINTIYQVNDKILDALSIHYPLNIFQIAILYENGHVELYQLQTGVTFSLSFKNKINMPYKLYYVEGILYVSDYIQGMIQINLKSKSISEFQNKEAKVLSVNEIKNNAQIFYYTTKKLIKYDQFSQQEICLIQNQQIQQFSNISRIYVSNNIMVLYSYKALQFYQLNPFKEIINYSQLIRNRIIDVLEYGINQHKYLIVQENGQIDLITIQIEQKKSNHLNLINLDIEDVRLSYLFDNECLIIVSSYGISIFDQNFLLSSQLELPTSTINIFEFQNNLYAIKKYNNYTQPFVLKECRNIDKKQIVQSFDQKMNIKQIFQINQYLIIITVNQILLYDENKQLQVLGYQSYFQNSIILDNQYLLLSNDQKLQLYYIQNGKLQLSDQIEQEAIQIKSHFQQNQATIFNENGYIQLYQVDQSKLIFQGQSNKYLDLSSYYIDQQNLIICRFNCQLDLFRFPFTTQINEEPLHSYQLNSIAMLINYDQIINEYQVICQNGQYYKFDSELNLKQIINPFGLNNIVLGIQNFQNNYVINMQQQRVQKYLGIDNINEYNIKINQNDELFLSNKNELYLLNNLSLAKIQLKEKELDFLNANFTKNKEQILLLKDNILITETSVYRYLLESFELMQNFQEEGKVIQIADIQGQYVVLLFEDSSLCTMQVHEDGQKNFQIYQIKENYKFQNIKLSKDIIILTYQNEVTVYSLNKFEKLDQFKAIYPDKNVTVDEQIVQIQIDTHSDSQLILTLLIQYAGIVIIYLKLNKNNGITIAKLHKKIHSPIDNSEHLRMQIYQSTCQLFNTKKEYQVLKQVHHFFDSSLQPIQKPILMNDCIIDSIIFDEVVYYIGICGALWSLNLD